MCMEQSFIINTAILHFDFMVTELKVLMSSTCISLLLLNVQPRRSKHLSSFIFFWKKLQGIASKRIPVWLPAWHSHFHFPLTFNTNMRNLEDKWTLKEREHHVWVVSKEIVRDNVEQFHVFVEAQEIMKMWKSNTCSFCIWLFVSFRQKLLV